MKQLVIASTMCLSVALAAGCGGNPTAPLATRIGTTTITFNSDPQHYVGQGRTMSFTLDDSAFAPQVGRSGGYVSIAFRRNGDSGWTWGMIFTAPTGQILKRGTYDTTRFETSTSHGFDFFGDGRGCGSATGRLTIHDIEFGPDLETLRHLRASFEHHCEGASPGAPAV
jgi:hypothetical protein